MNYARLKSPITDLWFKSFTDLSVLLIVSLLLRRSQTIGHYGATVIAVTR